MFFSGLRNIKICIFYIYVCTYSEEMNISDMIQEPQAVRS